jgi:isoquinoline 1-oxidoreductase subunit beta
VPAKTDGTAQFTIDIHEPGMVTVVVAHPPTFGGKVASVDANLARAVPGVVDIKQIPSGVAVYADATWPVLKARARRSESGGTTAPPRSGVPRS